MNKKLIVIIVVLVILGIVVFALAEKNQKKAAKPVERYYEEIAKNDTPTPQSNADKKQNSTDEERKEDKNVTEDSSNIDVDDKEKENSENKFSLIYDEYKIEVLAVERIKDTEMGNQNKYSIENFASGEAFDPMYLENVIDFEGLRAESPEYADMLDNLNDYTYEERMEITERNRGLIEKYTGPKHPDTTYVFLKMRITDLKKYDEEDKGLSIERAFYFGDPPKILAPNGDSYAMCGGACYLDLPRESVDDIHEFSKYVFKKNESIELIAGYEVRAYWEDEDYYWGYVDQDLAEQGVDLAMSKYLIKLNDLPGIE